MSRFTKCPYSYHLHYVEKIKPMLESTNLVFGRTIHDTLASWYDNPELDYKEYFKAKWENIVSEGGVDFEKKSPNELENTGLKMLDGYKSYLLRDLKKYEVIAIEESFEFEYNDVIIEGIIDLILKNKETSEYEIFDHKCLAKAMNEDSLKLDLQFLFYILGASKLGYEVNSCSLNALYKTKEPKYERIVIKHDKTQYSSLYEEIEAIAKIKDEIRYKNRSFMCNSCEYFQWCLGNKKDYWQDQ